MVTLFLGKNEKVNSLEPTEIKSHKDSKTNSLETPTSKNHNEKYTKSGQLRKNS